MYTKLSLFPRKKSFLSSLPNDKRIHKFLRNLCTAAQRLDYGNPIEDSSGNGSVRYGEGSQSVDLYNHKSFPQTQTQSWPSNTWQQNHNTSQSSYSSGTSFDPDMYDKILEFDAFCKQDNPKFALKTMEELEKNGYVFDIARLLCFVQLCGGEEASKEVDNLQQTVYDVWRKIRSLVNNGLDVNNVKHYVDYVITEFDSFCKQGRVKQALHTVDTLASMGHVVDLTRLLGLAKLCGEAEALKEAKSVHSNIASFGYLDVNSYHVLIEMYSSCALVNEAFGVFEEMPEKNLTTWEIMIRCLAKNGLGEDAIDMFTRFKNEGNKPDGRLFQGVFYACGELGDVDEGLLHFESMFKDYGIVPSIEHYVSIVEMYALPGFLNEAIEFVEKMPIEPTADVWETLMNLSRIHGDLSLGDRCAELVDELDPTRLNKQSRDGFIPVRESDVEKASLKKKSGFNNLLRGTGRMHEFRAGDMNLPENGELFELLVNLKKHMLELGYVCETKIALHDVDPESKEIALLAHSERIAFARGVLNSAPRSPFTVIKNIRVCIDCHNAFKLMGKIVGRAIIMRDAKRFHHMKDGVCTCKDYW